MFQHAQSMQEVAPSFLQDIYKHYQFQIILLRLSIGFCSRSPTKNEQIIFNPPLLLTLLRSQLIMCSGSTAFHPTKGPQFISQVWRAFCEALSGKVKLKGSIRRQESPDVLSSNPSFLTTQPAWMEYPQSTHTSSSVSLSCLNVSLGYQPVYSLRHKTGNSDSKDKSCKLITNQVTGQT